MNDHDESALEADRAPALRRTLPYRTTPLLDLLNAVVNDRGPTAADEPLGVNVVIQAGQVAQFRR